MTAERKKYDQDCLKAINDYRSIHQGEPLKINPDLCKLAQQWAEILLQRYSMSHSGYKYRDQPLGENVFMKWTSDGKVIPASEAVDSWYNEIKDYDFSTGSGKGTGHFTQLVWKGSKEVGIGRALSDDLKFCFVVTNYYPPGNVVGRYKENVLKPSGGATKPGVGKSATDPAKPRQSALARFFKGNSSNSNQSTANSTQVNSQPTLQPNPVQVTTKPVFQPNPVQVKSQVIQQPNPTQVKPQIILQSTSTQIKSDSLLSSNPTEKKSQPVLQSNTVQARSQPLAVSNGVPAGVRVLQLPYSPSGHQNTDPQTTSWRIEGPGAGPANRTVAHRQEIRNEVGAPGGGQTTWSYRSETIQDPGVRSYRSEIIQDQGSGSVRTYRVENTARTNVVTTQQRQVITRKW